MQNHFSEFSTDAFLSLTDESFLSENFKTAKPAHSYTFIWNRGKAAKFTVDGLPVTLESNSILTLTPIQFFQFHSGEDLVVYQFNREFYCIKDHDKEVGCAGLLFFGNDAIPVVRLDEKSQKSYEMLYQVFLEEFENKDNIQAEMLRMLMARFIIKTTRLLKTANSMSSSYDSKTELFRNFNMMVEEHFRKEHSVKFYADLLNKSPKTLANTFSKLNKSPLKVIHDRIVLEIKRQLTYTDKSSKEIAYDIGFDDASHLSRLFKKHTKISPSQFKKQQITA